MPLLPIRRLRRSFVAVAVTDRIICWKVSILSSFEQNPKPLFAYSDLSVVQSWLLDRVGLVSFHGPMAAADFYRDDGVHHPSFNAAIDGGMASLGAAEGLRTLRPGSVTGTLYGGCLSMIVSSLGTPFAPKRKASCSSRGRERETLPDRSHAPADDSRGQAGKGQGDYFRRDERLRVAEWRTRSTRGGSFASAGAV